MDMYNVYTGMDKRELINFIQVYDDYVTEFKEEHDDCDYPVCTSEFYECEFQEYPTCDNCGNVVHPNKLIQDKFCENCG